MSHAEASSFKAQPIARNATWSTAEAASSDPIFQTSARERSLAAIRAALTIPKPFAPLRFQPVKVVTTKGQTITGLLKNQHNSSYQILGNDEKLYLLLSSEIESIEFQKQSLMPAGKYKSLPAADLDDLVAYLSRQARSRR